MAKYSKKAQDKVAEVMHEEKKGKLKSGSGQKVTSRKQAIAIALSEARREGAKVPNKSGAKKSAKKAAKKYTKKGPKKSANKAGKQSEKIVANKSQNKQAKKSAKKAAKRSPKKAARNQRKNLHQRGETSLRIEGYKRLIRGTGKKAKSWQIAA